MRIDTLDAEFRCDDCEQPIKVGAHSVIADDLSEHQYCRHCYAVRAACGREFDPDPIQREGTDDDGPRGGEAGAYQREQMVAARSVK